MIDRQLCRWVGVGAAVCCLCGAHYAPHPPLAPFFFAASSTAARDLFLDADRTAMPPPDRTASVAAAGTTRGRGAAGATAAPEEDEEEEEEVVATAVAAVVAPEMLEIIKRCWKFSADFGDA